MRGLDGVKQKDCLSFLRANHRNEARLLNFEAIKTYKKLALKIDKMRIINIENVTECSECKAKLKSTIYSLWFMCEDCMIVFKKENSI